MSRVPKQGLEAMEFGFGYCLTPALQWWSARRFNSTVGGK